MKSKRRPGGSSRAKKQRPPISPLTVCIIAESQRGVNNTIAHRHTRTSSTRRSRPLPSSLTGLQSMPVREFANNAKMLLGWNCWEPNKKVVTVACSRYGTPRNPDAKKHALRRQPTDDHPSAIPSFGEEQRGAIAVGDTTLKEIVLLKFPINDGNKLIFRKGIIMC